MEFDPEIITAFENLQVSTQPISAAELAAFDENAPLKQRDEKQDHPSFSSIPRFFHPPPKPEDKIRQMLRREAYSLFLQQQAEELPDSDEVNELWKILEHHVTETTESKQMIDYDNFLLVKEKVSDKCKRFIRARVFVVLALKSSVPGTVDITSIYQYVTQRISLEQGLIGICFYDELGQGFLVESDLENYVRDIIPTLAQISNCLDPSFEDFYVCTVVKMFFFFLDPLHTKRIQIEDIVSTGMLSQIIELRDEPKNNEVGKSEESQSDPVEPNWFSMETVMGTYNNYLRLDKDHNGLLSQQELAGYGSGSLTSTFLDRVFQVCRTYDGEMDYRSYLDFVFALEYRNKPPALHYLFRLLDIDHQGFLTAQTLHCFFEGIKQKMEPSNEVSFQDLKDEIFDMIKPKDPLKITLSDLINSGQGDTVVSILIEYQKFCAYENRDENPQNV